MSHTVEYSWINRLYEILPFIVIFFGVYVLIRAETPQVEQLYVVGLLIINIGLLLWIITNKKTQEVLD